MSPSPYYSDESVTIWHGDCRDVLASVPPCFTVDALITDPPYGIGWGRATWEDDPNAYPDLMRWLVERSAGLVPDGWCFVFQAMPNIGRFHEWFPDGWRLFAACKNFVQMRPTEVQYGWDPVVFWRHGKPVAKHRSDAGVVTRDFHVGDVAGALRTPREHPSPRPLDTMRHIVKLATTPDRPSIVDPFMGSGTTLVAAKAEGRKAMGVEIDERYCEIAAERCSHTTTANRCAQGVLL